MCCRNVRPQYERKRTTVRHQMKEKDGSMKGKHHKMKERDLKS